MCTACAEMGAAFLSELVQKHVLLRRTGSEQFYFGIGCVSGELGVGWPAKIVRDHLAIPDPVGRTEFLVVLNPDEWEAVSVRYRSPLWQATTTELNNSDVPLSSSHEVNVKDMFCPAFLSMF